MPTADFTDIQDRTRRILNFSTRASDKAAYCSPSRGAQGNALKTILGIPSALEGKAPVIVESQEVRHSIRAWTDPAGNLQIDHHQDVFDCQGTRVAVTLPGEDQIFFPMWWGKAFALLNPHALVRIRQFDDRSEHANFEDAKTCKIYQPSVDFPGSWRKWLPSDLTSVHWCDLDSLKRLLFSHIAAGQNGSRDFTLREFICQFRGLSGTAKAKLVCDELPGISRLNDCAGQDDMVKDLLVAMRRQNTPPSPHVLGVVGEPHFLQCFQEW